MNKLILVPLLPLLTLTGCTLGNIHKPKPSLGTDELLQSCIKDELVLKCTLTMEIEK